MTNLTPGTKRILDALPTIEERAAKATPGPWRQSEKLHDFYGAYRKANIQALGDSFFEQAANAAFIAAARDDVPRLCAAVRELSGQVKEREEALAHCAASLDHLLLFRGSALEERQREGHVRNLRRARAVLEDKHGLG